jgi:uncharacterized membrane protein
MTAVVSTTVKAIVVPQAAAKGRILAIDALRGVALIVMALEHAAGFVGTGMIAETYLGQPAQLESWPHWVSGLVTNLAAPTFWFLSGVSISLLEASRRRQGISEWGITRFLLTRAAIITLLDLTLASWLWPDSQGNVHVLLSLAVSMALLSVLRLVPIRVFTALTVALIAGYQALAYFVPSQLVHGSSFWHTLWLAPSYDSYPYIEFPVLGWAGLMWFGYALGTKLSSPFLRRPRGWMTVGGALLGLWLVLRVLGGYGDLMPYVAGQPWYYFFVMSKAPLSLTYLAFNLGLSMFVLASFSTLNRLESIPFTWLVGFGQVSLFFFVIHPDIYRVLGQVIMVLSLPGPAIARAYLAWLVGLIFLIPLTQAYRTLRRRYPHSILRYL